MLHTNLKKCAHTRVHTPVCTHQCAHASVQKNHSVRVRVCVHTAHSVHTVCTQMCVISNSDKLVFLRHKPIIG